MKKYSNNILLIKFVTFLLVNWNLFAVTSYLLQGSISNLVDMDQPVLSFTKPICFQSLHVYMVALFLITQEFYLKV